MIRQNCFFPFNHSGVQHSSDCEVYGEKSPHSLVRATNGSVCGQLPIAWHQPPASKGTCEALTQVNEASFVVNFIFTI